jgi:hypothetical protein
MVYGLTLCGEDNENKKTVIFEKYEDATCTACVDTILQIKRCYENLNKSQINNGP